MKGSNCLITKLYTSKPYNRQVFSNTMRKVWRPTKAVWFHEAASDMILVEFEDKLNKERVLREIPKTLIKTSLY